MSFFEIFTIVSTMVGCTYVIVNKMNTFVTHDVCTKRRDACYCLHRVAEIENKLEQSEKVIGFQPAHLNNKQKASLQREGFSNESKI